MHEFTNDLKKMFSYLFQGDNKFLSLKQEDKSIFLDQQINLFYDIFLANAGINFSNEISLKDKEKLCEDFIEDMDQDLVDSLIDSSMKSFIPTAVNNLQKSN